MPALPLPAPPSRWSHADLQGHLGGAGWVEPCYGGSRHAFSSQSLWLLLEHPS